MRTIISALIIAQAFSIQALAQAPSPSPSLSVPKSKIEKSEMEKQKHILYCIANPQDNWCKK